MPKSPDAFVYNATLERIVDGDTFECCLDLGFDVKLHKQGILQKKNLVLLLNQGYKNCVLAILKSSH